MTHQPVQRVIARYQNGLVLKGHTRDFQPTLDRFHLLPADERSNNERCFVLAAATTEVSYL